MSELRTGRRGREQACRAQPVRFLQGALPPGAAAAPAQARGLSAGSARPRGTLPLLEPPCPHLAHGQGAAERAALQDLGEERRLLQAGPRPAPCAGSVGGLFPVTW